MGASGSKSGAGLSAGGPKVSVIKDIGYLKKETAIFARWTVKDVRQMYNVFRKQVHGFSIVATQFETLMGIKPDTSAYVDIQTLFDVLDNDNDGRIDGLEFLGGVGLICRGSLEDKARFCFELYDFNLNSSLSLQEMVMMMQSSVCGMLCLTGGNEDSEPDLNDFERLGKEAFKSADGNNDNSITFDEFLKWARTSRDIMEYLDKISRTAEQGLEDADTDDSASDVSEDCAPEIVEILPLLKDRVQPSTELAAAAREEMQDYLGLPGYRMSAKDGEQPDSNLELEHIHGYSFGSSRTSAFFATSTSDEQLNGEQSGMSIVYPAAAVGVVQSVSDGSQQFYQGHRSALSAIALHPSGGIVATADIGQPPSIHVWSVDVTNCMSYLVGFHDFAVSCLKFSLDGKHLASISSSPQRAIAIYDWQKGKVASSGHITSAAVYDAAFSPVEQRTIVIVGDQFVKFAQLGGRALKFRNGILRNGRKRQKFTCVTYVASDAVVGCASGELYRFQGRWCIQSIQAHSICEPVLSLHWSASDAILVSGGRDGLVKTWDSDLHEIGEGCDISVDVDGDGVNDIGVLMPEIASVCIQGSSVLVGTKSSDILLVELPTTHGESLGVRRLSWAHQGARICAVATHPLKQEYATGGVDCTVRVWSIRSSQIAFRRLPDACTALAYHTRGAALAIGMKNGTVSLVDARSSQLRTFCAWVHCNHVIVDLQFSPNGNLLAVASSGGDIFIYAVTGNFREVHRQALCRALPAPAARLDFSTDSQYVRCDSAGGELKAWTVAGRVIVDPMVISNTHWHSWRCNNGWHLLGASLDQLTAEAHPDISVVATGNSTGEIALYRFPLMSRQALGLTYPGHGGAVEALTFTHDWTSLITVGATDGTILQWSHRPSTDDSDSDDSASGHGSAFHSAALESSNDTLHMSNKQRGDELGLNMKITGGDEFMAVKPWKGSIVGPSTPAPQASVDGSSTDVDLELQWVHGYRGHDSRANLRYSADGSIVFPAAALAVVYNKGTNCQKFLQNKHTDDVLSLALHPNGNLAASGEIGKTPKILVWNISTLQVASTLKGFHQRGILHLAFSPDGAWLASIGADDDHQLAIYDWARNRFASSAPTEKRPSQTFGICVMSAASANGESARATNKSAAMLSRATARAGATTSRHGSSKVNAGINLVVVTCGSSGVKFWSFNGSHLSCQKGKWSGGRKQMLAVVTINELAGVCISSSSEGGLFYWKQHTCVATVQPQQLHDSAVTALWGSWAGEYAFLYSGDKSGRVGVSQVTDLIVPLRRFETSRLVRSPIVPHIKSVCEKDGKLLIGFASNEILEVWLPTSQSTTIREGIETHEGLQFQLDEDQPTNMQYIVSAHHGSKEVWALATHPTKSMFVTGADDQTIRLWEYDKLHRLFGVVLSPAAVRAIAIADLKDGDNAPEMVNHLPVCHLAAALGTGVVYVLDFDQSLTAVQAQPSRTVVVGSQKDSPSDTAQSDQSLNPVAVLRPTTKSALPQDIKYSPNGQWLAIGYHDRNIYCYLRQGTEYQNMQVLRAHNSYITHLDFGIMRNAEAEQLVLQSNCGAYELLFWELNDQGKWKRQPSASKLRDAKWATWTSTLGWPVQGIWPTRADGTDINAADRNHLFGELPVIATGDDFGTVKLFQYPCIAPGAAEKSYKGHSSHVTNVRFACDDSFLVSTGGNDKCVFVWKTDVQEEIRELHAVHGPPQEFGGTTRLQGSHHDDDGNADTVVEETAFKFDPPASGDQFMAVKPYQDTLIAPTSWVESGDCLSLPEAELELDFVYGYRSHDCRNNIGIAEDPATIIYHVAGVGITYDSNQHKQTRNIAHTDDIICLAAHPDGHIVATGELGKKPAIVLWDNHSGMTLHTLVGFHRRGVCCLAFSGSGTYLASIGLDDDHSLAIYNCSTGQLLASGKSSRSKVYCLAYCGDTTLVSAGDKHVKFWEFSAQDQGTLTSKKGLGSDKKSGSTTAFSTAYINGDAVTGMHNGQLLLWKGRNATKAVQGHEGPVWALASARRDPLDRIVSGGKDGKVVVWSSQLKSLWSFDIRDTVPAPHIPEIRALAFVQDRIVVGTKSSQIYYVDMATQESSKLVDGHFAGELWGLDYHPRDDCVVTCGDDGTVRMWDTGVHALSQAWKVGNKARAVCFSPDAAYVAVGLYTGHVQVLANTLDREIFTVKIAQNWIQTIKYSPDGNFIAVGGHDNIVYVIHSGNGGRKYALRAHSSYISHLDFSADSNFLQSTSGAYEMFFWDMSTGKRVVSATKMRDTNWNTWTCPIGWPVQGIWQRGMDGTDINAVARSVSRSLLVSGDDHGKVRLFRYPAPRENTESVEYTGHSSHVMNVTFARDDRSVFSVGGGDHSLMQFKVKYSKQRS